MREPRERERVACAKLLGAERGTGGAGAGGATGVGDGLGAARRVRLRVRTETVSENRNKVGPGRGRFSSSLMGHSLDGPFGPNNSSLCLPGGLVVRVGLCPRVAVAEMVLKYCAACVEMLLWDCAKMLLQLCQIFPKNDTSFIFKIKTYSIQIHVIKNSGQTI
jgi:hypothetical protein